ncbi:MAG: glycoside hydrolase family 3 protein [Akkermansiaceae bacterium]|nr:glycoside hydrolase family 3 protein [Akkermansiaceae bacterium]
MSDGALLLLGVAGPDLTPGEAALFRRIQPAGYILATRNIVSPEQTRKLTDDLRGLHNEMPILAIDGREGATRNIAAMAPSAPALARRADMGLIADAAMHTADLLRLLGINMNLGPVLDLDHFPDAADGHSWGRDPQRVIDRAGHWNRWMRKRSVASCAMHFPAGGRAPADPLRVPPSSDAGIPELMREDVIPYTALMPELDAILVAHAEFPAIDPDFPASFSKRMIQGFLRGQLGFDKHLVLTDDLDTDVIANRYRRGDDVRMAIEAGNDLAMIGQLTDTAEEAAKALAALPHRVRDDAEERVERFRRKKLRGPLAWSQETWRKTTRALESLAAEFSPETENPAAGS